MTTNTMGDPETSLLSPQDFVSRLLQAVEETEDEKAIDSLQQLVSSSSSPPVGEWMTTLVEELLCSQTKNNSNNNSDDMERLYLKLVVALARIDSERFLVPLAKCVLTTTTTMTINNNNNNTLHVPAALIPLWITQMLLTNHVSVHTNLLDALLIALASSSSDLWLQHSWQEVHKVWMSNNNNNNNNNKTEASIVTVRCVTLVVRLWDRLGDTAFRVMTPQVEPLLESLVRKSIDSDPLLLLTILDSFSQHLPSSRVPPNVQSFLVSKPMIQPLLGVLQTNDPLLGGAVLQYLAWIGSMTPANNNNDDNNNQEILGRLQHVVMQHVQHAIGVTSDESERLQAVHALLQLVSNKSNNTILLQKVLENPELRLCWWGNLTRMSSPKLQAAVLSSVRQLLHDLASSSTNNNHNIGSLARQVYGALGWDNSSSNSYNATTTWLFERYIKSPMPELRIATYGIWEALLQCANNAREGGESPSPLPLLFPSPSSFSKVDYLLEHRETTSDARIAKFEFLVTAASETSSELSLLPPPLVRKWNKLISMGPHGQEPQRWDVAME